MRIFGAERMDLILRKLGIKEGEAIAHPWINKALANAQKKVEARNFDMRKNVLKFDDVMNDQRKVIFEQRIDLMQDENVEDTVADMRQEVVQELVTAHIPAKAFAEQWDVKGLHEEFKSIFNIGRSRRGMGCRGRDCRPGDRGASSAGGRQGGGPQGSGAWPRAMREIEKAVLLQTLDHLWREHLVSLEHLRQAVGLRGYAQRDPLHEYKSEAFQLFEHMLGRLRRDVTGQLMHVVLTQSDAGRVRGDGRCRRCRPTIWIP